MKTKMLLVIGLLITGSLAKAQDLNDPVSYIPWKKTVLTNDASFGKLGKLTWGSGFLMKWNNDTIALTARDFTGTIYTRGKMLHASDFENELDYWKMYEDDQPSNYVEVGHLVLAKKIEHKNAIYTYSVPVWCFSLKHIKGDFYVPEPDARKQHNRDTVYVVGYDNEHNLHIIPGIIETALQSKWAYPDIRIRTPYYLNYAGFVGGPIVNREGKILGVVNRAYYLRIDKKGRIIREDKEAENTHHEFFVNGTAIGVLIGKDYTPDK